MKAVIQRVEGAKLSVGERTVSEIGLGLVVYLGVENGDTSADVDKFCRKLVAMRIFEDGAGKMNLSVGDVGGSILLVSNFTLCADISHGNRPSFTAAMPPDGANALYLYALERLKASAPACGGEFGADMRIAQVNAGPVTIVY